MIPTQTQHAAAGVHQDSSQIRAVFLRPVAWLVVLVYVAGTGGEPQVAVVALIAALFNPVRRHTQSFIDRRFYGRKYDAARTLRDFSKRLRDEMDLGALSDHLVGVVSETMQPSRAMLWLPETSGREQP